MREYFVIYSNWNSRRMLVNKKIFFVFIVAGALFFVILYGGIGHRSVSIKETTKSKEVGDFILHIHIANSDEDKGIKVFSSLQYIGEESIELEHQTPLVSVVLGDEEHEYTEKKVLKQLNNGNIYHPAESSKVFRITNNSPCELHFKAQFKVNDEEIVIQHTEALQVQ